MMEIVNRKIKISMMNISNTTIMFRIEIQSSIGTRQIMTIWMMKINLTTQPKILRTTSQSTSTKQAKPINLARNINRKMMEELAPFPPAASWLTPSTPCVLFQKRCWDQALKLFWLLRRELARSAPADGRAPAPVFGAGLFPAEYMCPTGAQNSKLASLLSKKLFCFTMFGFPGPLAGLATAEAPVPTPS